MRHQLVEDFDTEVTTIQAVITLKSVMMAALMIAGGKVGDLIGRCALGIGHAICGLGSLLTAVSWSVPVVMLGWSVLEGTRRRPRAACARGADRLHVGGADRALT